jgi:hypothetical protein
MTGPCFAHACPRLGDGLVGDRCGDGLPTTNVELNMSRGLTLGNINNGAGDGIGRAELYENLHY